MHQNGPLLHIIAFNSMNYLHNQFPISKNGFWVRLISAIQIG